MREGLPTPLYYHMCEAEIALTFTFSIFQTSRHIKILNWLLLSWKICRITTDQFTDGSLFLLLSSLQFTFASTSTGHCSPLDFLHSVLGFFRYCSWSSHTDHVLKSMFGFIFLCPIQGIMNRAKASCLPTTKKGSECKYKSDIWHGLTCFGEFFMNLCLGYCCLPGEGYLYH